MMAQKKRELTRDEFFMKEAIRQAKKAEKLMEVPIGCVIVYDDKIIAIAKAGKVIKDWRLEDCTMYITLEPCQMCAGAIVQARMKRVVIGSRNAKAGCAGSVLNLLQEERFNHQVELTEGVLEEECSSMLSDFFKELRRTKSLEKNA